jgi:hypothetical protein
MSGEEAFDTHILDQALVAKRELRERRRRDLLAAVFGHSRSSPARYPLRKLMSSVL